MKEIDPIGCELRRKRGIKRKQYINSGPNFAWHIDGYDKLKNLGAFQYMAQLMVTVEKICG